MKYYNYNRIKQIIKEKAENLSEASLGMHEDWFWTGQTIWEEGEYTVKLPSNKRAIALRKEWEDLRRGGMSLFDGRMSKYSVVVSVGAGASSWATPTLQLNYKDGTVEDYDVSYGESERSGPAFPISGPLTSQVQDDREEIKLIKA